MKKIISIFMLASIFACSEKNTDDIVDLKIVYINDMHAYHAPVKVNWIDEEYTVGGFPTVAGFVDEQRKIDEDAIFIDAGDLFTGPYFSALTEGEAIIDIVNTMGLDASTLGNHEFVYGSDILKQRLNEAQFDMLNINIFNKGTDELFHNNPYKIIERKGVKYGIIGLHGVFAFYDTTQARMIEKVEARDENAILQEWIDKIKPDVDIIIVLAHQGVPGRQTTRSLDNVEYLLKKDIELAQKVKGIDILLQGHTHVTVDEPIKVDDTLIISAGSYTYFTGVLDLKYDKNKKEIVSYTNKLYPMYNHLYEPKKETQDKVKEWEEKLESAVKEEITTIDGLLTRDYNQSSPMGNLFADAYMEGTEGADFAVINPGSLRQDHDKEILTYGDIMSIFPFPNSLTQNTITGKQIKDMFEHSATLSNGVLQVSEELEVVIDMSKNEGSRVLSIKLNNADIESDKLYKVNMNSFMSPGGDGFLERGLMFKDTGLSTQEVVLNYLRKSKPYKINQKMRVTVLNLNI